MSINSLNDFRQSKTVITVISTKLGYKYFDNKLNVTIGGNYVIGYKGGNEFWESGEELTMDWNRNEAFDLISQKQSKPYNIFYYVFKNFVCLKIDTTEGRVSYFRTPGTHTQVY